LRLTLEADVAGDVDDGVTVLDSGDEGAASDVAIGKGRDYVTL
jgi:hypothetical protein